jgi:ATP-dependent RNA helicase RhlE
LIEPLQRAIAAAGYVNPTPIQAAAIPHLLEGRDLLGCAQTGTGKTAAFALPILQRLAQSPRRVDRGHARALVLAPTRELALQIEESFRVYGKGLRLRSAVIFGGVGQAPQVQALASGLDIIVATPGRLLDLIQQKYVYLRGLEFFVLDEADRMLDMGFIHDVRKIVALLPAERQSLFFSATMPAEVVKLAGAMLSNPARVEVTPASSTVELIEQSVMFVERNRKRDLLRHLFADRALERVIVFTRTKRGANQVAKALEESGVSCAAIHGNKSQSARVKALEGFRDGRTRALIATDIAARGIDIDDVTHVINYEMPNVPETYVHRIGRTARAGAQGRAISFCDCEERAFLKDIERLIGQIVPVRVDHPYHSTAPAAPARAAGNGGAARGHGGRPSQGQGRGGRSGTSGSGGTRAGGGRGGGGLVGGGGSSGGRRRRRAGASGAGPRPAAPRA